MGGLAAIDIDNHTAFHLGAVQTPNDLESTALLEHYGDVLVERKQSLLPVSIYLVADAYFSKQPFVSKLCDNGFQVVSRLRDDAHLQYLYRGVPKPGRGRPQLYDGKVDYKKLNTECFELIEDNEESKIHTAIVHSKSLKRTINLVVVEILNPKNSQSEILRVKYWV